jgi:hypothetical protein
MIGNRRRSIMIERIMTPSRRAHVRPRGGLLRRDRVFGTD